MDPDASPGRGTAVPAPAAAHILGRQRLAVATVASLLLGLLVSPAFVTPLPAVLGRFLFVGLLALVAFGVFERWPARPPRWLPRWALQLGGTALAVPLGVLAAYLLLTPAAEQPFWLHARRLSGFALMSMTGVMLAPWLALPAMLRQREAAARARDLAHELERSELERRALDARMRLLQAQVEPHFLFNTLANVRALVDAGSPRASAMLGSLIAYLRAALPRLHGPAATLGQELDLVRAYLELMQLRMPDRLAWTLDVAGDATEARGLRCPPTTLLTLVENAVRHGLDPDESGGRIDIAVRVQAGRCRATVVDTGVGLDAPGGRAGAGTGLATLRERLQLVFGGDARLVVEAVAPRGVRAEVEFPAEPVR